MALPPVRSPLWPPAPTHVAPTRTDARAAAQKAFFEAALAGKAAATAQSAEAPTPRASASQAIRAATQVEANTAADKLPRPGSVVDIWV